jgi:apolipoprotein N-acyltransferase
MEANERAGDFMSRNLLFFLAAGLSGLAWYFSNGLNGNFFYLLWLAPVPVLLASFKFSNRRTFYLSFIAYLIGRLSWFSYLTLVATIVPALIFIIALALIFALIMIATRRVVHKINSWPAIFAFPVFFTTFEWLLIRFSPDGTAASIAYSQSDFLAIIQVASVTGILGITFIVTFIPSALALGWHFRRNKKQLLSLVSVSTL